VYNYYGSEPRIASPTQAQSEVKAPTAIATGNGARLWRAARLGQLPLVRRLLKLGADVRYRCNEHGTTALHQAAKNAHKNVIEALLEAGAEVDDEDNEGSIALHVATSADVVEAMVMVGADVDHENREGETPGRLALDRHNMAVVAALVSGRADLSKIYEPRKDTNSSRRVTFGNMAKETIGLRQDHIQGVPTPSVGHERDAGDHISAMATKFADLDMHLSDRGRNDSSSSFTPGDQSTRNTASQPHAIYRVDGKLHDPGLVRRVPTTVTPEVRSPPPTVDNLPTLNVSKGAQSRRLIIGIVRMTHEPTVAPFTYDPLQEFDYGYLRLGYAMQHDETSLGSHTTGQFKEFNTDIPEFLPYKRLPDRLASVRNGTSPSEAFRTATNELSELIEALNKHISTEIASRDLNGPDGGFYKEVAIVVPVWWSDRFKARILEVGCLWSRHRACHDRIRRHALKHVCSFRKPGLPISARFLPSIMMMPLFWTFCTTNMASARARATST
jgi:hypothetical protein